MMHGYRSDIEKVLLDNFEDSEISIKISVAWFTNKRIIEKLISLKKRKDILIEILVDDNKVNAQYFYKPFKSELEKAGIQIKSLTQKKFNHNKFSIIDGRILILGSYNYTINANRNLESIVVSDDFTAVRFFDRTFQFFTDQNYVDENITFLMENPEFANKIISSYYPFSKSIISKIESKVHIGYCFTHFNGLYNEVSYEAGLIFNHRWKFHKDLKKFQNKKQKGEFSLEDISSEFSQEFDLPIDKDVISNHKIDEINDFNFESVYESANYKFDNIDFEEFAHHAHSTEKAIMEYYKAKFKNILSIQELTAIVSNDVDLIKEDYIWIQNFAPFLTDDLVLQIFSKINPRPINKVNY